MSGARDPRLRELGAFLRARRADLHPDAADPAVGRRQVAGLRREEVAERAFISREYYTRIEQGRIAPSRATLDQLVVALALDDDQARYARRLLAESGQGPPAEPRLRDHAVPPEPIGRLLVALGGLPAMMIGPGTSILAWNDAAARMFIDFDRVPVERRTYVDLLFDDAVFQSRFRDLDAMRDVVVGVLRSTATAHAGADAGAELADRSVAFRERWRRFGVAQPRQQLGIPFRDPESGDIEVDQLVLGLEDPAQRLLVYLRSGA
ncbi:helix-turn-helix domain-containing protein [Gordonia sp. PP30]|uniref:helix-turn-helix domain-containing protein n=1 Tax=unclassified Gordonia (in: high G+C Gram-positive bacteria) TaxID=2657482 RepID=UPI001FFF2ACA|nr:helix-turn-helix domain-containing protein [Gordonia sp. PP30]UQE74155.1 helix-turn-helix domain-containing protein [Gordonia sp. PP30]